MSSVKTPTVASRRPTRVTLLPLPWRACAGPNPTGSTRPRFSSCSSTSEKPRSQTRSPENPGAPVGGMYGAELNGDPCVSAVLVVAYAGGWDRVAAEVVLGADEDEIAGCVCVRERGRFEGNKVTKLDEMRESVACAGCVDDPDGDADANVDVDADVEEGGEDVNKVGRDVVDADGEDIDGGEALPLRNGGSGRRDREGLGATLTLPPRSARMSFVLVISEASASASASSVDKGMGIGIGIGTAEQVEVGSSVGRGAGEVVVVRWVSRKYKGSSWC